MVLATGGQRVLHAFFSMPVSKGRGRPGPDWLGGGRTLPGFARLLTGHGEPRQHYQAPRGSRPGGFGAGPHGGSPATCGPPRAPCPAGAGSDDGPLCISSRRAGSCQRAVARACPAECPAVVAGAAVAGDRLANKGAGAVSAGGGDGSAGSTSARITVQMN
jgi:hypothetical protein